MNVLIVSNDSGLGGASSSLLDMIAEIRKTNHLIIIVPGEGLLTERLRKVGIEYYTIPFERDIVPADSDKDEAGVIAASESNAAVLISEIIRKESISIVHTNSSVGNAGCLAAIITGVPHIWHIRELMEEDFDSKYSNLPLKRTLFKYSQIITISKCVRDAFLKKYGISTEFIYNGLDVKEYRGMCGCGKKNSFILAGNISPNKGQWDAIYALEILKRRGYVDLKLYIVGDGSERDRWEVKNYIIKNGLDDMIKVQDYSQDLRLLRLECFCALVTSKMEALGRVTIEGMLAKQLVIGANTGGTKELIGENEQRGLLYEQGSAESLADTIEYYLSINNERLTTIIDRANKYANEMFDSESYGNRICDLYQRSICNPRNDLESVKKSVEDYICRLKSEKGNSTTNSQCSYSDRAGLIENEWMEMRKRGENVSDIVKEYGYRCVCIYGMGHFGLRLYDELKGTDIDVKFVIDKNKGHLGEICEVRTVDEISDVDVVIITVSRDEEDIAKMISDKTNLDILKLSEIFCGKQQ